ncbi:PKD domain-containing protein, partial [Gaetbulibacter sp. M235]|uniref:PKD domain-containing protein n=1 Tax=Gaetbulibacter sp. M235 TaxID=3126510 RepID=UPI00374F3818
MKKITFNLLLKAKTQIKYCLFAFVFLFIGLFNAKADCTVPNSMTGTQLVAYVNNPVNNCDGTVTIPAGVIIDINGDTTIPNTVTRLVIKEGGHIWWSAKAVLILSANTAIVIEDIDSTYGEPIGVSGNQSCNNNIQIRIGTTEYSRCVGEGNNCISFANLIDAGGTPQLDPNFAIISGTDNAVCFGPTDISIELNGLISGAVSYEWTVPPVNTNPGTVTFSPDDAADTVVTVSTPGTYTLRIKVNIALGLAGSTCASSSVDVFADIIIEFKAGVTATTMVTTPGVGGTCNLDVDFTASTVNAGVNTTYLWNFGDGSPTSSLQNPSHTYAASGNYNVSLTVTDPDGIAPCNVVTVYENVVITDNAPTITPPSPSNIEGCDISDAPAAKTTVADLEAIGFSISDDATGDSDLNVSSSDVVSGTCPIVITRTYTITDDCGNSSEANQIINIDDTTKPTINTQATSETVECDGSGNTVALNAWLASNGGAAASDNCSSVIWSNNFTALSDLCGATGAATVTFRATDACGNYSETTATFTIEDKTPPTIDVVATNSTVECDGSGNTTELNAWLNSHGGAAASDSCGGVTWSNNFTALSDLCGTTGAATVTFKATDACGNYSETTATFTIKDTIAPTISNVAADQTVQCDGSGNTTQYQSWLNTHAGAVANDNCSNVTWSYNIINVINDCGSTSRTLVDFIATDDCGNKNSSTALFTIVDFTPPTISTEAADSTVECDGAGNTTQLNAWLAANGGAVATDNCGGVTWSNNFTALSDLCGNTGSATVTFRATDACDNYKETTATFTIVDNTDPLFVEALPGDVTVECDAVPTAPTLKATDNCGTASVDFNEERTDGSCPSNYSLKRTWTATDECGRTTTHVQTITVQDTIDPVLSSVPADDFIEACSVAAGLADYSETAVDITGQEATYGFSVVEACNFTVTYQDVTVSSCPWTVTRTFTAIDACGNSDTKNQTITITPSTLSISDVQNETVPACTYATQGELDTAFAAWLNNFTVSGGCAP